MERRWKEVFIGVRMDKCPAERMSEEGAGTSRLGDIYPQRVEDPGHCDNEE